MSEQNNLESNENSLARSKDVFAYNKTRFLGEFVFAAAGVGVDSVSVIYAIVSRNPSKLLATIPGTFAIVLGHNVVHEFKEMKESKVVLAEFEDKVAREKQETREE